MRRPRTIRASPIAISSIRRRAGSSPACGLPSVPRKSPRSEPMALLARRRAHAADHDPATRAFATDVAAGLSAKPKTLLPKYFYDSVGSQLFEQITVLPEYY